MPKWMLSRALTLAGALGVPVSGAVASTDRSVTFSNAGEARAYLRENPTGPDANAAFMALAEFPTLSEGNSSTLVASNTQIRNSATSESEIGGGQY